MSSAILKYSLANSSECSKSQPLQTIWFGLVNAWTNSWYRFLEAFVHICGKKKIEACPSNAVVRVPSPKDRDCMQILGLNIDREMDSSPVLAGGSAARISAIKTEMQLLQYNNSNTHTCCSIEMGKKGECGVAVGARRYGLIYPQGKHPMNCSSLGEKALLMAEVHREWPDRFELIRSQR